MFQHYENCQIPVFKKLLKPEEPGDIKKKQRIKPLRMVKRESQCFCEKEIGCVASFQTPVIQSVCDPIGIVLQKQTDTIDNRQIALQSVNHIQKILNRIQNRMRVVPIRKWRGNYLNYNLTCTFSQIPAFTAVFAILFC